MHNHERIDVLGVTLDAVTIKEAVTLIVDSAADPSSPARYVVKAYIEFLDRSISDPSVKQLMAGSWLTVADGVAGIWAAHFLYAGPRTRSRYLMSLINIVIRPHTLMNPLPERIAGINFTIPLLELAQKQGIKVLLLGRATQHDIEHTRTVIGNLYPNLNIVAAINGRDTASPLGQVSEAWVTEKKNQIESMNPDLILVGMGFPLQERVMHSLISQLEHGIFVGEGGTFDYEVFGGSRPKAPVVFQTIGLEWLWRLVLQPSRWRRQLAIPRYIRTVWRLRNTK